MAACNNVLRIEQSEFLGSSLFKINTNNFNLDNGICELGKNLQDLNALLLSLSAKDSPTIDMSFSPAGYFLSADVINNSLGTNKLGQDIPLTTKVFLTGVKISSLIDTNITNVKNENALKWNGTKWINTSLTDLRGALRLYELFDVYIDNNTLSDKDVLKYNNKTDRWENSLETGLSGVLDDNYEDINVTGGGQIWNINPGKVSDYELKNLSVATSAISAQQITNVKFFGGITLNKCAFSLGEVNTGVNVGSTGIPICLTTNQNKQIPLKTLKGVNCSIKSYTDHIEIEHAPWPTFSGWPPARTPFIQTIPSNNYSASLIPQAANTGTGLPLFIGPVQYTSDNPFVPTYAMRFKTIKARPNNRLEMSEPNTSQINLFVKPTYIATSIYGNNPDGTVMSDDEIANKLTSLLPPDQFITNTICSVVVQTLNPPSIISQSITFNLSIRYMWYYYTYQVSTWHPGSTINWGKGKGGYTTYETRVATDFDWEDPAAIQITDGTYPRTHYRVSKTFTNSSTWPIVPPVTNLRVIKYKIVDANWVMI